MSTWLRYPWCGPLCTSLCAVSFLAVIPHLPLRAQHPIASNAPAGAANTRAAEMLLARVIDVQIDRQTLREAINQVATSGGITIVYRSELVDRYRFPVTLHLHHIPLGAALDTVLVGTSLRIVSLTNGRMTIRDLSTESAQVGTGSITGRVTNAKTGQPIRGVKIGLDGADRVVETSDDGRYQLTGVASGAHTVSIKALGYAKTVRTVKVADGDAMTLDVALTFGANMLDQVVVTGTVIPTELKAVPNAITVITAKQIEERGITRIDQLFRGDVPGLFSLNQGSGNSAWLDEVVMFSRGATALSDASAGTNYNTNSIKTYVDGVEMADPKYLSQIDPKSIERIEILTGPQASTIYGSNAINGVMQIFTKRGTTNTPQLTLNLLSGWVQNNFSSALTPQHDYSAQLNGLEGRISYNAGGSWNYMGPWTPAKQTSRTSGFGGGRLELPTSAGRVTADLTFRRAITQSLKRGDEFQTTTGYQTKGWYIFSESESPGLSKPTTSTLTGQTLGLALTYAPASWWSHEFGLGVDASDAEQRFTAPIYARPFDTTLSLSQSHTDRHSLRYATTARVPVTSLAQFTVTVGADAWQNLTSSWSVQPQTLTGSLTGRTSVSRTPGHNTGGFLQTQFGVGDRLFLTYGLRAEWNPGFGEEVQPNYAPRYGVAYTRDIGAVTAKVRASYGRSTRPPASKLKDAVSAADFYSPDQWAEYAPYYPLFDSYFANPELAPEHQQGGEGGLELYLGTRGSLTVTRYNQTVDRLITAVVVDSVDVLPDARALFGLREWDPCCTLYSYQYVNAASIRNQGWELQGNLVTGPLTTRATYSWTKSRTIGVTPKYRAYFANSHQYQRGATFDFFPEHTWALGITYARAASSVGLNVTGTGRLTDFQNDFYLQHLYSFIRLPQNKFNVSNRDAYISFNRGHASADLTISQRFTSRVEGVLQVQNLTDHYTNDLSAHYAVMGRQSKMGLRCRL